MRVQLYRGHANATTLSSSPVVSALGSEADDPGPSPGQGKALCPWDVREKKMRAPFLGLAKSIYILSEYIFSILYNFKDSDKNNLFDNQERHLVIISFILMTLKFYLAVLL